MLIISGTMLNRKEIAKLEKACADPGFTIVPLRIFISERGLAKMVIGVARGKKAYDKRQSLREKDDRRAMDRVLKNK